MYALDPCMPLFFMYILNLRNKIWRRLVSIVSINAACPTHVREHVWQVTDPKTVLNVSVYLYSYYRYKILQ